jgi:4a-hydroxytetrahydrobiopterin dehydratase
MKIVAFLCALICVTAYADETCSCELVKKKCKPCSSDIPPLKGEELDVYYRALGYSWCIVNEHHLEKVYFFPDFCQALAFTNMVGEVAEEEGHHPDILLTYGKVKIQLWTHKIDGLSESDFILAAKCDEVFKALD